MGKMVPATCKGLQKVYFQELFHFYHNLYFKEHFSSSL